MLVDEVREGRRGDVRGMRIIGIESEKEKEK
jgi:hypothetical protein